MEPVELVPLLDATAIERAIRRMAAEIVEEHRDLDRLALVGIPTRGVELAERLVTAIGESEGQRPAFGVLDIGMYRDDLGERPTAGPLRVSELPLPLEGRQLVLVDDVLFTGRTVRAALDGLAAYGRPDRVQLAVLIDRGHRELPIQPDHVGTSITTAREERIRVRFATVDAVEADAVWLVRPKGGEQGV